MMQATLETVENVRLARDTYRIRLRSPSMAAAARPGQFFMLRLPGTSDPLLGRPFALYDTVEEGGVPAAIDVVYLVVGKMTGKLARVAPGQPVEAWGPLGNGFDELAGHVALVAGGIGQTPFLAYVRHLLGGRGYGGRPARRTADRVTLYYGVRTAELAAGVDDFAAAGAEVRLASDDGTLGERGFVTQALARGERPGRIVGCGPEPMLKALSELAAGWGVPCQVSLETPMACGVGVCFSCVVKVREGEGWDYKRCCVEGPVFDAAKVRW